MTRHASTTPAFPRLFGRQATAFVLALGSTVAMLGGVNHLATEPALAAHGLPLTATMAGAPADAAGQVVVITARRNA